MRMVVSWTVFVLVFGLAACTGSAATRVDAPPPAAEAGAPAKQRGLPADTGEVDHSCSVDADCAVKNVGNCCGYFPACVNADSPTFPDRVQAECEREGRMSVCGFRDIQTCQCVQGRCEPADSGALQPG